MYKVNRRVWVWVLPVLLSAVPAAAQDERLQVSVGTASMAGSGDANLAWTASAGYRFRERLLFEVDLTASESPVGRFLERPFAPGEPGGGAVRASGRPTPGARLFRGGPMGPMRGPLFERAVRFAEAPRARADGDLFLATMGLRYELGESGRRLQPYVGAGLGLARTDAEFTLARRIAAPFREGASGSITESISRTGMAASAGIGTSLRVYRGLSLDADARYFVLDRGPNLTRVGGGVSYRF
jgi:hypothetical protein